MKRSPLLRRKPLLSRPRRVPKDPRREAWKYPAAGFCDCCSRPSWHLQRHHVVYEQHVRKEGGDVWAMANSMLLHPDCHAQHHAAVKRIPVAKIPREAMDFAIGLMGRDRAALYLTRYYESSSFGERAA